MSVDDNWGDVLRKAATKLFGTSQTEYALRTDARVDSQFMVKQAINEIYSIYGDVVSVDEKAKSLTKFGRNNNVGDGVNYYTIWYTGQDQANETYPADNANTIDTISSSNSGDTMQVTIEGHIMSGGNRTFRTQTATLNGQNKVTLTTPLNRSTRCYVSSGSTANAGQIFVYRDTALTNGKPTNTAFIHLTVPAGFNQSEKASTSLSSSDYWIVTRFSAGYLEKTGANTAEAHIEFREVGGVWRRLANPLTFSTGQDAQRAFGPYKIIPKNADVRIRAQASAAGEAIEADMAGFLAKVVT